MQVGGKVAECVGKALLLPEDMKHQVKWDDDSLLINMKREAIMVTSNSHLTFFYSLYTFFLINLNFFFLTFGRDINVPWSWRKDTAQLNLNLKS